MVQRLLDAWCRRHLGAGIAAQFFGLQRLSAVHGVRLADGREVVLKVRDAQPRQRACAIVHEAVWDSGAAACPQPLVGPLPLAQGAEPVPVPADGSGDRGEDPVLLDARGLAVNAETWEGEGRTGLGALEPQGWGALLARMTAVAPPVAALPRLDPPTPWLHWAHGVPGRVWPPPASPRWDPHRVEATMDPLVPEVAHRAAARLSAPDIASLPVVAGHGDFEAQNCRWVAATGAVAPRLVVHDWDSVVALSEAVIAGNSAMTFVSTDDCDISSLDQNDAFLEGYARERGRPWSALEWQAAHAAGAWVAAYNAAFEHLKDGPGPVTAGLHGQGRERLARAGA
ncbi:MAG TPA: hypothetical protein VF143_07595 [Candidatus Nanopelagicales bacterium]